MTPSAIKTLNITQVECGRQYSYSSVKWENKNVSINVRKSMLKKLAIEINYSFRYDYSHNITFSNVDNIFELFYIIEMHITKINVKARP